MPKAKCEACGRSDADGITAREMVPLPLSEPDQYGPSFHLCWSCVNVAVKTYGVIKFYPGRILPRLGVHADLRSFTLRFLQTQNQGVEP